VQIEQPPPEDENVTATDFGNLDQLASGNYFAPGARKRLVVLLTDGESRPFDANGLARSLAHANIKLVVVHVSEPGQSIYVNGAVETAYHEDYPGSTTALALLANATGGSVVGGHDVGGAVGAAEAALGSGPTVAVHRTQQTRTLAPFVALLALVPLLLLAREGSWRRLGEAVRVVGGSLPGAAASSRRALAARRTSAERS